MLACARQLLHPEQPGQFIPDVQAFVPAMVSCLKRLAVIAHHLDELVAEDGRLLERDRPGRRLLLGQHLRDVVKAAVALLLL